MTRSIATASTVITAPPEKIWRALTTPQVVREYMVDHEVHTDWKRGSAIRFTGEHRGQRYEDKGEICVVEPSRRLSFTRWNSLSGEPDWPENHHLVTYRLEARGNATKVTVLEENVPVETLEERSAGWTSLLERLKAVVTH